MKLAVVAGVVLVTTVVVVVADYCWRVFTFRAVYAVPALVIVWLTIIWFVLRTMAY